MPLFRVIRPIREQREPYLNQFRPRVGDEIELVINTSIPANRRKKHKYYYDDNTVLYIEAYHVQRIYRLSAKNIAIGPGIVFAAYGFGTFLRKIIR